jgi:fatty acid-binding protein DegV
MSIFHASVPFLSTEGIISMLSIRFLLTLCAGFSALLAVSPMFKTAEADMIERAKKFMMEHEAKVRKLETAANQAWWDANTRGDKAE